VKRGFLVALLTLVGISSAPTATSEYGLKAAFLLSFASFVEWPAAAFASPNAPLTVCVFGKDPFGGTLDDVAKKKTINGRVVLIRAASDTASLQSCQIAFVPGSETRGYSRIANTLSDLSVLTVGETSDFTEGGGIVTFVIYEDRLRFEINSFAAERAHLKLSSKLLQLALVNRR
jgi:hypothetical protein